MTDKKHNYFYKITNLINGKFYYGIRSTDRDIINDFYLGSGIRITDAIKKYGKENFIKEIIADYPTRKEASDHERLAVTMDLVLDENCYNLRCGGLNGNHISQEQRDNLRLKNLGKKASEETLQKMREVHKNITAETRQKMSKAKKGTNRPPEVRQKISESNLKLKRKHTQETKERISSSKRGKKHTDETKEKMSLAKKNKPRSESVRERMRENHFRSKKCIINGIIYKSQADAGRHLNIEPSTVKYRIKSEKWNTWQYYVEESMS